MTARTGPSALRSNNKNWGIMGLYYVPHQGIQPSKLNASSKYFQAMFLNHG